VDNFSDSLLCVFRTKRFIVGVGRDRFLGRTGGGGDDSLLIAVLLVLLLMLLIAVLFVVPSILLLR